MESRKQRKLSLDHFEGCMLGGAVGDALGAPIEFMSLDAIRAKHGSDGITDYVEFNGHRGAFTDDTQMSIFTAEGLLRSMNRQMSKGIGGSFPQMVHNSYLRWLYTQGFEKSDQLNNLPEGWIIRQRGLFQQRGPGNTCLSALLSGEAGSLNRPINDSKGCGTVMRVAPVGLLLFHNPELAFDTGVEASAITHGHPTGYLSGGALAAIIAELAIGTKLPEAIRVAVEILKHHKGHEETLAAIEKALELASTVNPENATGETIENLGQGWVAEEALSISLFASVLYERQFRNGVLLAVNHSGDCDSTGAITGNILGLINGTNGIPDQWIRNLQDADLLREVGNDLHINCKGDSFNYDERWDDKYPPG